jgi:transposase InsO family protein
VLPFYDRVGLKVGAVLTDNGREFCGTDARPFEFYLALAGIEHRKTRARTRRSEEDTEIVQRTISPPNGFVERFNGTVLDEFFRVTMRVTFYASVEALQADLDTWLVHDNTERPHLGYRTMGRRPVDTIRLFVSREGYVDSAILVRHS